MHGLSGRLGWQAIGMAVCVCVWSRKLVSNLMESLVISDFFMAFLLPQDRSPSSLSSTTNYKIRNDSAASPLPPLLYVLCTWHHQIKIFFAFILWIRFYLLFVPSLEWWLWAMTSDRHRQSAWKRKERDGRLAAFFSNTLKYSEGWWSCPKWWPLPHMNFHICRN